MALFFAAKPALPGAVIFTPRGLSTLTNKPQRVRSNSTSTLPETRIQQDNAYPAANTATGGEPPLSALRTPVLLRSLLVATISPKPSPLLPSLSALSFLCKPRRGPLLNVDRNPILHGILKSIFYKQFCAGETHNEVRRTIRQLSQMGFQGTIMTYAKETVFDHKTNTNTQVGLGAANTDKNTAVETSCPQIEAWRKGTLETVELLDENDYLAVKLTGAGPAVTQAFSTGSLPPPRMLSALDEISSRCEDRGVRILVDAESHHFLLYNTDGFARVYNTYQAYLKSTPETIAKHLAAASEEGFTLGLKLVRGAYIASDERSLIHDTKGDTDNAYNGIAQGALRQELGEFGHSWAFPSVDFFLASHNKESVLAAHALHQQRLQDALPTVPVGFGQLHGMSDELSFSLLRLKGGSEGDPKVYKCSTWGGLGECLAYLLRRAIENRDAVGRTGDEYRALKAEVARRVWAR